MLPNRDPNLTPFREMLPPEELRVPQPAPFRLAELTHPELETTSQLSRASRNRTSRISPGLEKIRRFQDRTSDTEMLKRLNLTIPPSRELLSEFRNSRDREENSRPDQTSV
jgi:hypothetical protein